MFFDAPRNPAVMGHPFPQGPQQDESGRMRWEPRFSGTWEQAAQSGMTWDEAVLLRRREHQHQQNQLGYHGHRPSQPAPGWHERANEQPWQDWRQHQPRPPWQQQQQQQQQPWDQLLVEPGCGNGAGVGLGAGREEQQAWQQQQQWQKFSKVSGFVDSRKKATADFENVLQAVADATTRAPSALS